MKFLKTLSLLGILFFSNLTMAQNGGAIEVGDELTIGAAKNRIYSHINFPKENFILKKGRIADFDKLQGILVTVTDVRIKQGKTQVIFARNDGKKFFGSFSKISANYEEAIASGELIE